MLNLYTEGKILWNDFMSRYFVLLPCGLLSVRYNRKGEMLLQQSVKTRENINNY